MTTKLKVLDALPGCGKTHSIFRHMSQEQHKKWLYLSPMAEEINVRVHKECEKHGVDFFVPSSDNGLLGEQVLQALSEGKNVACTHALMMRFTDKHIEEIKKHKYSIVCDEELNLISGYRISDGDIEFLLRNDIIDICEKDGRVSFKDDKLKENARFADVKKLADMECLYAAKRDNRMLVTQLSTRLIRASEEFILLTYNYKNSIMQTFMQLHGYEFEEFNLQLRKSTEEVRSELRELIDIVEPLALKKIQGKYPLSKSWWIDNNKSSLKQRQEVINAIRSVVRSTGIPLDDMFYTLPKKIIDNSSVNKTYIKKSNFVACNVKATNEFKHKKLAIHAYALYPNQAVKSYMQDMGYYCNDEVYALNMLIQWLFRGCIRDFKPMKVALLSKKMSLLFKEWLMQQK